MSGGIYPKAKALVPGTLRSLSSIVLILIAAVRMKELADIFAVAVGGFSVMDNHFVQ